MTNPHDDHGLEAGRAAARQRFGITPPQPLDPGAGWEDNPVNRGRLAGIIRHGDTEQAAQAAATLQAWANADAQREQQRVAMETFNRSYEAFAAAAQQNLQQHQAPAPYPNPGTP